MDNLLWDKHNVDALTHILSVQHRKLFQCFEMFYSQQESFSWFWRCYWGPVCVWQKLNV